MLNRDYEVFCPKCHDEDVEITVLNPPDKIRISMDDLPGTYGVHIMSLVVDRKIQYKATCKNCGYSKTWSS